MSLSQLKSDESEVIEAEVDYVGSSNSGILESGLYPCFVKVAYLGESSGGAITLNIHSVSYTHLTLPTIYSV